jgi:hypothetical protein
MLWGPSLGAVGAYSGCCGSLVWVLWGPSLGTVGA